MNMALKLQPEQIDAIHRHAAAEYPNECCGALLGSVDGASKQVAEVVALSNLRHDAVRAQELIPLKQPGRESERNRYLIDPREQLRVEKDARARGLSVLGYYHSHPDHPAAPSEYDREHAWPWYSYIIVSVEAGTPRDIRCWVLVDDRSRFETETMDCSVVATPAGEA
jgi:proteasome lid subunit RPN8/RPN11